MTTSLGILVLLGILIIGNVFLMGWLIKELTNLVKAQSKFYDSGYDCLEKIMDVLKLNLELHKEKKK